LPMMSLEKIKSTEVAIKQACGLSPDIQQTAQKNYIDAVKLIKDFGFTCSVDIDFKSNRYVIR